MSEPLPLELGSTAVISADGRYRYSLTRRWDAALPPLAWMMLNPSTADADADDATIRRCVGFAKGFGYGAILVVNLFAWRSPSPLVLFKCEDPVGAANPSAHRELTAGMPVVAAWGAFAPPARYRPYVTHTATWLRNNRETFVLGFTAGGQPSHPLYLSKRAELTPWPPLGAPGVFS